MVTAPYLSHGSQVDLAVFTTIIPGDPVDVATWLRARWARRQAWLHCTPADVDPVIEVRREGDMLAVFVPCLEVAPCASS